MAPTATLPRLELLACPDCSSDLSADGNELVCAGCGRGYAIRDGMPRLTPARLESGQDRTAAAFGWEWRHFTELHPEYEEQFLS